MQTPTILSGDMGLTCTMRDREAIVLSEAVGVMSAYDAMIKEPASASVLANLASDNYGGLKFRKGKEIVGQLAHFQNVEVADNVLSQVSRLMSRLEAFAERRRRKPLPLAALARPGLTFPPFYLRSEAQCHCFAYADFSRAVKSSKGGLARNTVAIFAFCRRMSPANMSPHCKSQPLGFGISARVNDNRAISRAKESIS